MYFDHLWGTCAPKSWLKYFFTFVFEKWLKTVFVNLKSNSAFLYNKGHNLLTSAFPQKLVKLIKFPFIAQIASLQRREGKQAMQDKTFTQTEH